MNRGIIILDECSHAERLAIRFGLTADEFAERMIGMANATGASMADITEALKGFAQTVNDMQDYILDVLELSKLIKDAVDGLWEEHLPDSPKSTGFKVLSLVVYIQLSVKLELVRPPPWEPDNL
jgi:hypothetical protein